MKKSVPCFGFLGRGSFRAGLIVFCAGFFLSFIPSTLRAEAPELTANVLGAYYIPHFGGYQQNGFASPRYEQLDGREAPGALRSLGSTWGGAEAKASLSLARKLPFMVGEGPFLSGNSLSGKASVELSPVSFNVLGQASLTPIAFLVFETGLGLGTGWTAGPFRGLGINPEGNTASDIDLTPFGGAVWRIWGAGTFQFDLAALLPGEWNHVILAATAKVEYKAFSGAGEKSAWLWEADSAENFNGAKYLGTYIAGYQMPLKVNFAGLMVESEEWLPPVRDYGTMASRSWGSDFRIWQIGSLANLTLGKQDSLLIILQFKQNRDWTDGTTRNRDFRTREYEGAYWFFNRLALSYTHVFAQK